MTFSHLSHLDCARCGRRHDADTVNNLCECGSPLLARYDLAAAGKAVRPADIAGRPPTLWRYHEVLPVREEGRVVSLGEGMTPLLPLAALGQEMGVPGLLMKDDGLIPTGSFKARGAAVGVSRAAELGVTGFAMPSNGNAAAAWAMYGARAGLRSVVAMPEDAPTITRAECAAAGADLFLVRGHIGDAGRMIADLIGRSGGALMDASTLKEPYRIEGKKTMAYEIVEQLGWRCPDVIVYPTGGGVGLIGIHKALAEMRQLGWITGPQPRLVAVQATGCAPVVQAFRAGAREAEPWPQPRTVAFGLTVPKPLGDFLILDALYDTNGTAVAVDDADTLAEQLRCAQLEGAFICPEGAAALAAVRVLRKEGWVGEQDQVVVLNTGAGVKYPETVTVTVPTFDPGDSLPTR
ncbi:threonine synthase [Actinocrispum wychmicini]|uniref:Threonine synthase n=1 Tax=Actinocrispum wychmicini TaxID=1213861 RepID=A0A4R2JKH0_9PSEU|nr:threonine synthase [Actinocrispum wychmicini]TCO60523.1 threonine synthase [Actinocrispum wychmicini]